MRWKGDGSYSPGFKLGLGEKINGLEKDGLEKDSLDMDGLGLDVNCMRPIASFKKYLMNAALRFSTSASSPRCWMAAKYWKLSNCVDSIRSSTVSSSS